MLSRFCSAVCILGLLLISAQAQTVRFDTNVGTFDLELNPMGNANLQGHVDNMLAYVEGGFYNNLVINRADDRNSNNGNDGNRADDFVLQMGRFNTDTLVAPDSLDGLIDNQSRRFDAVVVDADSDGTVDFDTTGLTNTRGFVSLALSGTDSNSGTNEFFINLGDNSFLDAQDGGNTADFVPFAVVRDMATIDLIFGLNNQNLFDGAFTDVPLLAENRLVYVERAFVLPTQAASENMLLSGGNESLLPVDGGGAALQSLSVPEPSALVLALGAMIVILALKPQRKYQ